MRALLRIGAALVLAAASPAAGQDRVTWTSDIKPDVAYLHLAPEDGSSVVWRLHFRNEQVHVLTEDFTMDLGGQPLGLRVIKDAERHTGAEQVVITSLPPGWSCDPCQMTVGEYDDGHLSLVLALM